MNESKDGSDRLVDLFLTGEKTNFELGKMLMVHIEDLDVEIKDFINTITKAKPSVFDGTWENISIAHGSVCNKYFTMFCERFNTNIYHFDGDVTITDDFTKNIKNCNLWFGYDNKLSIVKVTTPPIFKNCTYLTIGYAHFENIPKLPNCHAINLSGDSKTFNNHSKILKNNPNINLVDINTTSPEILLAALKNTKELYISRGILKNFIHLIPKSVTKLVLYNVFVGEIPNDIKTLINLETIVFNSCWLKELTDVLLLPPKIKHIVAYESDTDKFNGVVSDGLQNSKIKLTLKEMFYY